MVNNLLSAVVLTGRGFLQSRPRYELFPPMKFEQLLVLLPCNSLEDLSLTRDSTEAEEILSAWSALYHPLLLATTGCTPQWGAASNPPTELAGKLIVLPACSELLLPSDWLAQAETSGAVIIRGGNRSQILDTALASLN